MKITEHELSDTDGLIYLATNAKDAPTKLLQHRQLLDRLKLYQSALRQPHPNDERLRFALFTLFDSVSFKNGRCWVEKDDNYLWAMRTIFEIAGFMSHEQPDPE